MARHVSHVTLDAWMVTPNHVHEIIEEIGRGGFAVVYRARDTKMERPRRPARRLPHRDSPRRQERRQRVSLRQGFSIGYLSTVHC